MKKHLLLFLFCGLFSPLLGKIGCIDNSWHLKKEFDSKAYHYVHCNCKCPKLEPDRNQCTQCKHFHDPASWTIIKADSSPSVNQLNSQIYQEANADSVLKYLISRYKIAQKH